MVSGSKPVIQPTQLLAGIWQTYWYVYISFSNNDYVCADTAECSNANCYVIGKKDDLILLYLGYKLNVCCTLLLATCSTIC